jgi:hypothetical protein
MEAVSGDWRPKSSWPSPLSAWLVVMICGTLGAVAWKLFGP